MTNHGLGPIGRGRRSRAAIAKQARLKVATDTIDAKIAAYSTPAGYLNWALERAMAERDWSDAGQG
jgi:hypothetical protein